jgi:hypothetical protein
MERTPIPEKFAASIFFDSTDSLRAFSETELAKTIASAYEVTEIRKEVYTVLYPLHPERGPAVELEST